MSKSDFYLVFIYIYTYLKNNLSLSFLLYFDVFIFYLLVFLS